MLRRRGPVQSAFEMVSLEDLVPADHLFRKIEATVDFSFIHDRVPYLNRLDRQRERFGLTVEAVGLGYCHYKAKAKTCANCPIKDR